MKQLNYTFKKQFSNPVEIQGKIQTKKELLTVRHNGWAHFQKQN